MKKLKFIFYLVATLFVITSCVDIDVPDNWGGGHVNVYGPVYVYPGTTDANGNFAITFQGYQQSRSAIAGNYTDASGYDAFKLFAWMEKGDVVMNPYTVKKDGNNWAYTGVDDQETQYYDKSQGYYDFISVISDKTPTSTAKNTVKVEGVESFLVKDGVSTDKELLHATAHVTAANYSKGMTLPFVHDNAVVRLQFCSNDANTKLLDFRPVLGSTVTAINTNGWVAAASATSSVGDYQGVSADNGSVTQTWIAANADVVNAQYKFYNKTTGAEVDITNYRYHDFGNIYIKVLDKSVDKFVELGGCACKPFSSYQTSWPTMQSAYDAGYRVVGVQSDYFLYVKESLLNGTEEIVPSGTPAIEGIVVLPSTSESATAASTVCKTADATITNSGVSFVQKTTYNSLTFSLTENGDVGTNKTSAIKSPTNFYTLPVGTEGNGLCVKVSYEYKGTKIYDSRVFIPADKCQWESGNVYTYTININGIGNGTTDPTKADPTDPKVDNTELEVGSGLNLIDVTVSGYTEVDGGEYNF